VRNRQRTREDKMLLLSSTCSIIYSNKQCLQNIFTDILYWRFVRYKNVWGKVTVYSLATVAWWR